MPRRPQQRSIRGEEVVVRRRIAWELAQRGWSNHDLARELTAAGHPTHPSAVSKLLNGSPPRRITLNEFAALAEVLGRTPEELLTPQEVYLSDRANELLRMMEEAQSAAWRGLSALRGVFIDVAAEVEDGDQAMAVAHGHVADLDGAIRNLGRTYADLIDRVYGMDDYGPAAIAEQDRPTQG